MGLFFSYALSCHASAWLVAPKHTKLSYDYGLLDKYSLNLIDAELQEQKKLSRDIAELNKKITELQNRASDVVALGYTQAREKMLISKRKILQSKLARKLKYDKASWYRLNLEYGVNDNYNLLMSYSCRYKRTNILRHKKNSFTTNDFTTLVGCRIKLKERNNIACSLTPALEYSAHNSKKNYLSPTIELNYAKVRPIKKKHKFINNIIFNCGASKMHGLWQPVFNIATKQEIELQNGISTAAYNAIYLRSNQLALSGNSYSELAIYLNLAKLLLNKEIGVNLKMGYFQVQDLTAPRFKISGMTFSLWYVI